MASKENLDRTYIRMALELSKLSRATRKKVGCLIVKDTHIIAEGYNGTPKGFENRCEDEIYHPGNYTASSGCSGWVEKKTKPEVIHAEMNAIAKLCRSTQSSDDSIMYLTLSPCYQCCKLIIQCGIKKVIYLEKYRDTSGLELLSQAGVTHYQLPPEIPESSGLVAS